MAFGPDNRFSLRTERMTPAQAADADIDVGLRAYMLQVYNYMASGLALTGIVSYFAANTPAIMNMLYAPTGDGGYAPTMLAFVAMFAPLILVFFFAARIHRMQASTAQALFWVYSALMGLSLAHVFLAFTGTSITRVFFITAGTFAAMSLYGYTTKRDLSKFGSFLMMGLIGIIIASIVNIFFLQSSALQFGISIIGVLVFVGFTAYDTQAIREMYSELDDSETYGKKAIMGALKLYLDFINLFIMLLYLFGDRR